MDLFASPHVEIWIPMIASILTGSAIGLERELNSKAAGVRTHALVCFSSAILMMAASRQEDWLFEPLAGTTIVADPTRMAHGILTGIGFLGAGVILRQGHSVRGLTTAASVWMTASLGVLYGAGLNMLAAAGTVTALVVLVIFRLFHIVIPDRLELRVEVTGDARLETGAVTAVLGGQAVKVGTVAWKRVQAGEGARLRLCARVWLRNAAEADALDQRLAALEGVASVSIAPVTELDRLGW